MISTAALTNFLRCVLRLGFYSSHPNFSIKWSAVVNVTLNLIRPR